MGKNTGLIDPVKDGQEKEEGRELDDAIGNSSILDFDFKPLAVETARQSHPFEGYPMQKIKIGSYIEKGVEKDSMVYKHALVALNPSVSVPQDISGKGITQKQANGEERIVNLKSYHNRSVVNSEGRNEDVVFDRDITLPNGKVVTRVAIVPDHLSRAQLFFTINKRSGKVEVDTRYALLDTEQAGRLRKTFEMYNYQQTRSERLASQFYSEPESRAE
jgi:hypothetical protein